MKRLALFAVGAAVGVVHVRLAQRHSAVVKRVANRDAVAARAARCRRRGRDRRQAARDRRRDRIRADDGARVWVGHRRGERLGRCRADALEVAARDADALEGHRQLQLGHEDGAERGELPRVVAAEVGAVLARRREGVVVVAEREPREDAAVERAALVHLDAVRVGRRFVVGIVIASSIIVRVIVIVAILIHVIQIS